MRDYFLDKADRIIIVFLSLTLCCGSLMLYKKRHTGILDDISVAHGMVKPEYTIEELDRELSQKAMININKASKEDIMRIPGIGPVMAERILLFKKENGSFSSVMDLLKVPGIGPKKCEHLKEHIKV
jgi:comEA protein